MIDNEQTRKKAKYVEAIIKQIEERIVAGQEIVDSEQIRKKVEYVKAITKQIEERIVAGSEDFFESQQDRDELHITIRIASEFHKFLLDFGEMPPKNEVSYVRDTIRSGIDEAFLLAFSCRIISDEFARWNFERQVISSFQDLRSAYLRRFQELCRPEATAGEMLASLLALVHLELVFVAQTFPSIMDSES